MAATAADHLRALLAAAERMLRCAKASEGTDGCSVMSSDGHVASLRSEIAAAKAFLEAAKRKPS